MATEANFTKRNIEALAAPVGATRAEYRDSKRRGLTLHVSPTGQKTFYLYRKIKGRPERIKIGTFPDTTVENARQQASLLNAAIDGGANPAEARRLLRQEPTLGELFEIYLTRHIQMHGMQEKDVKSRYNVYLRPWKSKKLSDITPNQIKRLHESVAARHSGITANHVLTQLRTMYNRAAEWELFAGENPTDGIKKFPVKDRDRFLQPDELPIFFKTLSTERNETFHDFVLLALLTGARKMNVLAMRWEQINFEHATWTIPKTKNGEPHTVPLVQQAIDILVTRQADSESDWIFPGASAAGHYTEPKKAWASFLKRAGIRNLRIHDLRRTMGSWQAITGASLSVIAKSLAHKDVSTTQIYSRLHMDPVRDSMSKAAGAMLTAGGKAESADVVPLRRG